MDSSGILEPDDSCWYVFGRIAEQFGLADAARDYYGRLERPKTDRSIAVSSYTLAQKRLKGLK